MALDAPQHNGRSAATSLSADALSGTSLHPDDDPAEIDRGVRQAAYFSLFSTPNPASPPDPIPLIPAVPALSIAIAVHESLHRFEVNEPEPNAVCGFRVSKSISRVEVAKVHMQMTPMPNNFQAGPERVPPPTILLPFLSQRICALNGSLEFLDNDGSGFGAFGSGRTFPANVNGQSQLRLAAVLDVFEGSGKLAGFQGTGIVSGETTPPSNFAFGVMFRIVDPDVELQAHGGIVPLQPNDPTPDTAFLTFLSEPDGDSPLEIEPSADGKRLKVRIAEVLRLVHLNFDVDPPGGLRSKTTTGAIVGTHRTTLTLDLSNRGPVIPCYSKEDRFCFFDRNRKPIGGFNADLFEARIFPTNLPGLQTPIFRIGGIAPPTQGTGQFKNPVGMVSVNGAFSLATGALSTMYVVRLSDPLGKFRTVSGLE